MTKLVNERYTLGVVENIGPDATIIKGALSLPRIRNGNTDLICGKCDSIIWRAFPIDGSIQFQAPAQLLIQCSRCGAHNDMPFKAAN